MWRRRARIAVDWRKPRGRGFQRVWSSRAKCVQIMTGAAVPRGANAVVMQEYARMKASTSCSSKRREGAHFVLAGQEARIGETVLARGTRLSYAELAMAAQVGRSQLVVAKRRAWRFFRRATNWLRWSRRPAFQIRNSNSVSLAAQVALAGGEPVLLGTAPDKPEELRARIEQALEADMLVLSGGVSVGKYDLVEEVLRDLGAEFFSMRWRFVREAGGVWFLPGEIRCLACREILFRRW